MCLLQYDRRRIFRFTFALFLRGFDCKSHCVVRYIVRHANASPCFFPPLLPRSVFNWKIFVFIAPLSLDREKKSALHHRRWYIGTWYAVTRVSDYMYQLIFATTTSIYMCNALARVNVQSAWGKRVTVIIYDRTSTTSIPMSHFSSIFAWTVIVRHVIMIRNNEISNKKNTISNIPIHFLRSVYLQFILYTYYILTWCGKKYFNIYAVLPQYIRRGT